VLQEGEIKPLGSDYSKKVNVRIISATNKDLETSVKGGEFREDLYYRLNVFTIKLPPLRERTGDIPILVNHFIRKYNEKHNKSITGINRETMRHLEAYPFSGNVRELENEIERAIAMAENGKPIRLPHLSDKIRNRLGADHPKPEAQGTLKQMVESLEKDLLKQMLKKHQGNKSRTAKALGLSRYGLSKKLQRYGFTPSDKQ
jgi:transcriptional regulator with PAS, ATPase and Fis domain